MQPVWAGWVPGKDVRRATNNFQHCLPTMTNVNAEPDQQVDAYRSTNGKSRLASDVFLFIVSQASFQDTPTHAMGLQMSTRPSRSQR